MRGMADEANSPANGRDGAMWVTHGREYIAGGCGGNYPLLE